MIGTTFRRADLAFDARARIAAIRTRFLVPGAVGIAGQHGCLVVVTFWRALCTFFGVARRLAFFAAIVTLFFIDFGPVGIALEEFVIVALDGVRRTDRLFTAAIGISLARIVFTTKRAVVALVPGVTGGIADE